MAESNPAISETIKLLYLVKNCLPSNVEYFKEDSGEISCWTNSGIQTWGLGRTYDEAREDLLNSLKEIADIIREDLLNKETRDPQQILYMLKILTSSNQELREWLSYGNI